MKWTAIVVVALLFLGSPVSNASDWDDEFVEAPRILSLDDKNFEHETQAATGQTTGSWLILFTSSGCVICGDVESALLQVIPKLDGGLPIIAKVNISASPWTAKRFYVQKRPQLKLFRDRHMFSYGGQWSAASIHSFIEDGWRGGAVEDVPREWTLVDEIQEKIWAIYKTVLNVITSNIIPMEINRYFGNRPGILIGIGSMTAMGGYLFTKQLLMKKQKLKRPRGRPRKRSD